MEIEHGIDLKQYAKPDPRHCETPLAEAIEGDEWTCPLCGQRWQLDRAAKVWRYVEEAAE